MWTAWCLRTAGPASAPEELDGAWLATTEPQGREDLLRQELELLRCVFEEVAILPFLSTGKCRLCFFLETPSSLAQLSLAQTELGFGAGVSTYPTYSLIGLTC